MPVLADRENTEEVTPTANDIRDAMSEIDREIFTHVAWLDEFNTALICREPADPCIARGDAHCCAFGKWYDHEAPAWIRQMDDFVAMGGSHRRMHEKAAGLMELSERGQPISRTRYEAFLKETVALRNCFLSLKHALEDQLFDFDPLTGAGNRIGMLGKLHQQQELVNRHLVDCMLVMMDIDLFKSVNDTYGHTTGDRALVAFAQYIIRSTRSFDMLFRYGGEEFLLCAPQSGKDMALETVDRLREGLMEVTVSTDSDEPGRQLLSITASFGIAFMEKGITAEETIRRADIAVYAAKQAGRNCTKIWSPDMGARPRV